MKARDKKNTKKSAEKKEVTAKAPKKRGNTSAAKAGRNTGKSSASRAASIKSRPGKKAPLKKPLVAKTPTAKKTVEKPSDETKKLVQVPAVKKPVKATKKTAGTKKPSSFQKSTRVKTKRVPAAAAGKPKAVVKKPQKSDLKGAVPKNTASVVHAASVRKIGTSAKGPLSREIATKEKSTKTAKKTAAERVEKRTTKAGSLPPKPMEKNERKVAAKVAAEKVVSAKPSSKTARKLAVSPRTAEKLRRLSPKDQPVSARAATKTIEEKTDMKVKAAAKGKRGPAVTRTTREVGKPPAAKTERAKKITVTPAKIITKAMAAENKYAAGESAAAVAVLPVKPERVKLKIFLPSEEAGEEELREGFIAGLPEEYGENALIAMAVDPNTIFVDWEVVPGEIAGKEGELMLRFYDVTRIDFDGNNAHAILDMSITQRVGSGFFAIRMPGRDVIVEAGILGPDGRFHSVVRSDMVSFPFLLTFDDLGIVQGLFASGIPIGY